MIGRSGGPASAQNSPGPFAVVGPSSDRGGRLAVHRRGMDRAADHRRQLLRRRGAGGGRRRPQRRLAAGRPAVPARDPAGRRRRPGPARAPGQWPLRSLARRVAAPGHRRRGRLAAGVRSGRSGHHHPGTGGVAGLAGAGRSGTASVLRPARRGGAAADAPADGRRARPAGYVGQPVRDQRERRLPAAGEPAVPGAGARRTPNPASATAPTARSCGRATTAAWSAASEPSTWSAPHTRWSPSDRLGRDAGTVVPQRPAGRAHQPRPGAARAAGFPRRRRRPGRVRAAGDLARGPGPPRWPRSARRRSCAAGRAARHRSQPPPRSWRAGSRSASRAAGSARTGDYWQIPARTVRLAYGLTQVSGTIDWPPTPGGDVEQPPAGTEHHLTPLAILVRADGRVVARVGLPGAVPGADRPGDDRPGRRRRPGGDARRPAAASRSGSRCATAAPPWTARPWSSPPATTAPSYLAAPPASARRATLVALTGAGGTRGGAGALAAQPGGADHADPHRATAQRPRAADRRPGRGHRPAQRRLAGGLEPRPGLPQLRRDPHRAGGAADPDLRPRDAVSRR